MRAHNHIQNYMCARETGPECETGTVYMSVRLCPREGGRTGSLALRLREPAVPVDVCGMQCIYREALRSLCMYERFGAPVFFALLCFTGRGRAVGRVE